MAFGDEFDMYNLFQVKLAPDILEPSFASWCDKHTSVPVRQEAVST